MHIDANSTTTRLLAGTAILGLTGCGMAINASFGWQSGHTEFERAILAGASVCFDFLKVIMLPVAAYQISKRAWGKAGAAGLIWVACVLYGLNSAFGFAGMTRAHVQAERQGAIERVATYRAAVTRAEREIEESKAAINDKGRRIWDSTGSCLAPTTKDSLAYCTNYYSKLGKLEEVRRAAPAEASLRDADPLVTLYARLLPASREQIEIMLAIGLATFLELISSLAGLAVSKSTLAPTRAEKAERIAKARATREANKAREEARRHTARRRAQEKAGRPGLTLVQ